MQLIQNISDVLYKYFVMFVFSCGFCASEPALILVVFLALIWAYLMVDYRAELSRIKLPRNRLILVVPFMFPGLSLMIAAVSGTPAGEPRSAPFTFDDISWKAPVIACTATQISGILFDVFLVWYLKGFRRVSLLITAIHVWWTIGTFWVTATLLSVNVFF